MESEKEIAKSEQETREFLETLSPTELRRLLNTPMFSGVVLEYAATSEALARNVDEALDAEYREMPEDEKERVTNLAARLAEKFLSNRMDDVSTAPEDATVDDERLPNFRELPPWLHLSNIPAEGAAVYLSAQQEGERGWPVELSADVEGLASPIRLKFNWHLSFLVAEFLGSPGESTGLLLCLAAHGRELHLRAGGKVILGGLEEFGLSEMSSREQIVTALLMAGLAMPKVEKLS